MTLDEYPAAALIAISQFVVPGEYVMPEIRAIVEAAGLERPEGITTRLFATRWNSIITEAQKRGLLSRTMKTKRVARPSDPKRLEPTVVYRRTERQLPEAKVVAAKPDDQAHAA